MYQGLLHTHSVLRWAVLILGLLAIIKYFQGWRGKKPFAAGDRKFATFYIASLHTQLLIGLILYFISPIVKTAMGDMGAAMKEPALRFWAVEHITMMVVAVVVAQVGSIISKKAATDEDKYKRGFLYFLISFILILMAIPWPFREVIGRGFFPGM